MDLTAVGDAWVALARRVADREMSDQALDRLAAFTYVAAYRLRREHGSGELLAGERVHRVATSLQDAVLGVATRRPFDDSAPGTFWGMIDLLISYDAARGGEASWAGATVEVGGEQDGFTTLECTAGLTVRIRRVLRAETRRLRRAAIDESGRTHYDTLPNDFLLRTEFEYSGVSADPRRVDLEEVDPTLARYEPVVRGRHARVAMAPVRGGGGPRFSCRCSSGATNVDLFRADGNHAPVDAEVLHGLLAAADGLSLLVAPELCAPWSGDAAAVGQAVAAVRKGGVDLVALGSWHVPEDPKLGGAGPCTNRCAIVGLRPLWEHVKRGEFQIAGSKVAAPGFRLPAGASPAPVVYEDVSFGHTLHTIDTHAWGRIAVVICADVLSDNGFRLLLDDDQRRIDTLVVPSFSVETGEFEAFFTHVERRGMTVFYVNNAMVETLAGGHDALLAFVSLGWTRRKVQSRWRLLARGGELRVESWDGHHWRAAQDDKRWRLDPALGLVIDLGNEVVPR